MQMVHIKSNFHGVKISYNKTLVNFYVGLLYVNFKWIQLTLLKGKQCKNKYLIFFPIYYFFNIHINSIRDESSSQVSDLMQSESNDDNSLLCTRLNHTYSVFNCESMMIY